MKSTYLLQIVYIAAKLNGLAAFHLSNPKTEPPEAQLTTGSTIMAVCIAIGLNCFFIVFTKKNFEYSFMEELEGTFITVAKLENSACLLRNFVMSIGLIIHRKAFVRLINDVRQIALKIQQIGKYEQFLDDKCQRMVRWNIVLIVFQMGLIILLVYLYSRYEGQFSPSKFFHIICQAYLTNVYEMTVTAIHFTGLLIILQIFRHINNRLRECVATIRQIAQMDPRNKMRMQMYCDVSDSIDEIASLFNSLTNCTNTVCKVFSLTMLMVLTISFVLILTGVNIAELHSFAIKYFNIDMRLAFLRLLGS